MEKELIKQKQIAEQIKTLRTSGDLSGAVTICEQATKQYPEENFFYKILGDLQFNSGMYESALSSYIEFLKRIGEKTYLAANLFRFVNKLRSVPNISLTDDLICDRILDVLGNNSIYMNTHVKTVDYISRTFEFSDAEFKKYIEILSNPAKSHTIKQFINKAQRRDLYIFFFVINQKLSLPGFYICENSYKIIASAMEKNKFYMTALRLSERMLKTASDGVVIRTLFRLCRLIGNYASADKYLQNNPHIIEQGDFNIQYELVYYFKEKKDHDMLTCSLNKIRDSAQRSPAISKTLYNFYVQFEMLAEAEDMIIHMEQLNRERQNLARRSVKGEDTATETDEGVWSMLRDIVSEKEHNRQLIATKDLIKGFSHELGQPLTNIRYDIGYYFMKKKLGKTEATDIDDTLNNILRQISRIDKLMKRFSPIFSSKSEDIDFNVKEEIQNVFDELSTRLSSNQIHYAITGTDTVTLHGDPLKFHQIFYNLIINSIHAIRELDIEGSLKCSIAQYKDKTSIVFTDNGKGIPDNLANKIFEPFFSTKQEKIDHSKDDGGEGLGLYIVWNIVKMFDGTIHVNKKNKDGAEFILEFAKERRH